MIYEFVYISRYNKNKNIYLIVNTISKQYFVYCESMLCSLTDEKIKQLTYRLPKADTIQLKTYRDLKNLIDGLEKDESFSRV